jgi:hypothetical protein
VLFTPGMVHGLLHAGQSWTRVRKHRDCCVIVMTQYCREGQDTADRQHLRTLSRVTVFYAVFLPKECFYWRILSEIAVGLLQTISNLVLYFIFLFISCKFTIYSTNWAISKCVIRKHLCGAIIQWWFSYVRVYCTRTLCCACVYFSSSLWFFKSEGHCRFNLRLTFSGLLNSVT